jgi:hypothetical protein
MLTCCVPRATFTLACLETLGLIYFGLVNGLVSVVKSLADYVTPSMVMLMEQSRLYSHQI